MDAAIQQQLSFFFRSPKQVPQKGERFSHLYLLRRDILTCYGYDANTGQRLQSAYQALWPGVMAIMAGIDLLGKFLEGDEIGVGRRFRAYVEKYIDTEFTEMLYQLRCGLIHSFGLLSESLNGTYKFALAGQLPNGKLIQQDAEGVYWVDILSLHRAFEESIPQFYNTIIGGDYPITRFTKMVEKYGGIKIGL